MNAAKNLSLVVDQSMDAFLADAGTILYQNEAMNSLMVGLIEGAISRGASVNPLLIRVLENGKTVTAAVSFRKNPMNVILTRANEAQLQMICDHLKSTNEFFTGAVGPRAETEIFAKIWIGLSGKTLELGMAQKIFEIKKVDFPSRIVAGETRVATLEDLNTVYPWVKAFVTESLPEDQRTDEEWLQVAKIGIEKQGTHLWVVDGVPVSMAMANRPTKNGISISGVYTPPKHRKKGYASAVVANLSQKWLDQGKQFCVLYTDVANPTSNKIYQEIGYREVCESIHFMFK